MLESKSIFALLSLLVVVSYLFLIMTVSGRSIFRSAVYLKIVMSMHGIIMKEKLKENFVKITHLKI
jgi:hypothetical protein